MKSHFRTFPTQLRSELKRGAEMLERQGVLLRGIHGNITGKTREVFNLLTALQCSAVHARQVASGCPGNMKHFEHVSLPY